MAKGEAKTNNRLIDQNTNYNQNYRDTETTYQGGMRDQATNRQEEMYRPAVQGYTELSQTGGMTDADRERMRGLYGGLNDAERNIFGNPQNYGGGGGGGGGLSLEAYKNNPNQWNELEGMYRDSIGGKTINQDMLRSGRPYVEQVTKTGGYSPEFLQSIGRNMGMLDDIAVSGGVDSNSINRIRGNGIFDEFANTGGYSATDKSNIRSRATSAIPAYYDNLKRDAEQASRIGNSSMGGAALASRNARGAARGISDATRDAELEIMDRVNEGRQWGGSNMSQSEAGLANLQSANRMGALGQSTQAQRGMQEYMSDTAMKGGQWLSESEKPIQEMLTDERRFGMGGLDELTQRRIAEGKADIDARNAAASASYSAGQASDREAYGRQEDAYGRADERARLGLGTEQGMLDFTQQGRLSGLGGLNNLYGTAPAEVAMREGLYQGGRGQEAGITGENLDRRLAYNPNVSSWDRATNLIGAAAPVAGAFMGGFGGGGGSTPPLQGTNMNTRSVWGQYPGAMTGRG